MRVRPGLSSHLAVIGARGEVRGVLASYREQPFSDSEKALLDTLASQVRATSWLSFVVSVVGGLVAGLSAYGYLRRRDTGLRWPAYLAAGAGPGLLILLSDLVTRVGGARLLAVAGSVGADDRAAIGYLGTARLNTALVVLFVGALTTVIAFGRTLKPAGPT